MTPYYQDSKATIYHGDCREIFPCLPWAKYVVIADPPYAETSLKWDRWPYGWPDALGTAESMWCFGSFRMFLDRWSQFEAWRMSHEVVWEKHNGSNARNDRFRRVHELVVHFFNANIPWVDIYKKPPVTNDALKRTIRRKGRPVQWNDMDGSTFRSNDGGPRLMRSVLHRRSCHGNATNPTQKPESLIRPLLEYIAGPGCVVLDPFMGSGTVARVAKDMGLPSISMDVRESECEAAALRLSQEVLSYV